MRYYRGQEVTIKNKGMVIEGRYVGKIVLTSGLHVHGVQSGDLIWFTTKLYVKPEPLSMRKGVDYVQVPKDKEVS